jgi:hypothetical protein
VVIKTDPPGPYQPKDTYLLPMYPNLVEERFFESDLCAIKNQTEPVFGEEFKNTNRLVSRSDNKPLEERPSQSLCKKKRATFELARTLFVQQRLETTREDLRRGTSETTQVEIGHFRETGVFVLQLDPTHEDGLCLTGTKSYNIQNSGIFRTGPRAEEKILDFDHVMLILFKLDLLLMVLKLSSTGISIQSHSPHLVGPDSSEE